MDRQNEQPKMTLVAWVEAERKHAMETLQLLYKAVIKQTTLRCTVVNLESDTFPALELRDVVVDLYKIMGPDGLVPLV